MKCLLMLAASLAFMPASMSVSQEATIKEFLLSAQSHEQANQDAVSEGYRLLEEAVKEVDVDAKRMQEIVELQVFLAKNDPSNYSSEVIYTFAMERHKDTYEAALRKLSSSDRELILEGLRIYERELRYGNG